MIVPLSSSKCQFCCNLSMYSCRTKSIIFTTRAPPYLDQRDLLHYVHFLIHLSSERLREGIGQWFSGHTCQKCNPRRKLWIPDTRGYCNNEILPGVFSGSINVSSDFLLFHLPLPILLNLQMPSKKGISASLGVRLWAVCLHYKRRSFNLWNTAKCRSRKRGVPVEHWRGGTFGVNHISTECLCRFAEISMESLWIACLSYTSVLSISFPNSDQ